MYSFSWMNLPYMKFQNPSMHGSWMDARTDGRTHFCITDYNSFWKIPYVTFLPYKSVRDQIWPCRKTGQGQPRVNIWTNLVVLQYLMLHTNFQGNQLFGSREEDFFKVFTIYGYGGHIGHVTWTIWTNFHSPIPWRLHMKFGFSHPRGF